MTYEVLSNEELLENFDRLKRSQLEIKLELEQVQGELVQRLTVGGEPITSGGRRGSLVTASRVTYDPYKLKTRVSPEVYDSLFERTFSRALLEEAVVAGKVTPEDVVDCAQVQPVTPHVRLSDYDDSDWN